MTIFVFGNQDHFEDSLALLVSKKINIPDISFEIIPPNDDLPTPDSKSVTILDTVYGIDKITLITEKDLDKIIPSPRTTAHDYDLSFQLKYLLKLGKLEKINIIGLPYEGSVDYDLIHSILRKLVAQDIQGS